MTDIDTPIHIDRPSNPHKPDQVVQLSRMKSLSIHGQEEEEEEEEDLSPNPSTASSSSHSNASISSIPNTIQSNYSSSNDVASSSASTSSATYTNNVKQSRQQQQQFPYSYKSNPTAHITQLLSLDHSHLKPGQNASLLSYAQTINMYRENAKKTNNPDIQCELAKFIIEAATKTFDPPNEEYLAEAEKILKQLALKGHADAQYELAKLFAAGLLHKDKKLKPDLEKAFSLFVQASKHFHADASNRAGEYYEKGLGCRANGSKAVQFYKKAASLGHPGAMYTLGMATMNGDLGLHKNPKDAVKWLNRSVEAASPEYAEALHELANLHVRGIPNVVFVDLAYAVSLYIQAADTLNYAPSAFKLGECYEYGKLNCQPDPALSIHYYTIAAEKGDRDACFALTAWYLVGSPHVLPQSDDQAYIWAKRAAEAELPKAEYAVGYFTETGIGCVKSQAESIQWYKRAAEHGDKRAMQRLQQGNKMAVAEQDLKDGKKKKRSASDECRIM